MNTSADKIARRPALYVHVPFCIKKCDYCAFYSLPTGNQSRSLVKIYLEGLAAEMHRRQKDAPSGVSSLFMGGGTPTALTETDLEALLKGIHNYFGFEAGIPEKTVEGNPGTLTPEKLSLLRAFGINRFSLGVQSFDDGLLRRVGRIHSAGDARRSIQALRNAGFDNLNLDLMFGLPGQDLAVWKESVEEALAWQPEHLSLYGLMLEEGTPLYQKAQAQNSLGDHAAKAPDSDGKGWALPDDDLQADMYEWAVARLKQAGYKRYETSNFARPGFECRHNLAYWHGEEYLGLGPGAVSFQGRARLKNIEDIRKYREMAATGAPTAAEREELSKQDLMFERVMLGLRLTEGLELKAFTRDFGVMIEDIYARVLEKYEKQGILWREKGYLKLNPDYFFIANSILQDFYPMANRH